MRRLLIVLCLLLAQCGGEPEWRTTIHGTRVKWSGVRYVSLETVSDWTIDALQIIALRLSDAAPGVQFDILAMQRYLQLVTIHFVDDDVVCGESGIAMGCTNGTNVWIAEDSQNRFTVVHEMLHVYLGQTSLEWIPDLHHTIMRRMEAL